MEGEDEDGKLNEPRRTEGPSLTFVSDDFLLPALLGVEVLVAPDRDVLVPVLDEVEFFFGPGILEALSFAL